MQKLNYKYDDLNLKYYISGKGDKTILMFHGWSSSIKSYPRLIQLLNELNFVTVFLEFPGHGDSDNLKKAWTVKNFNQLILDFKKFIETQHELKFNCIYAHSNGGRVLLEVLPKIEKSLNIFLVASAGIRFRKNLLQKIISFLSPISKVLKYVPFYKFFRKILLKSIKSHDYLNVDESMKETFINLIEYDATSKLSKIPQDCYLIYGDQDTFTPMYMAEILNSNIKNSKLIKIPNMTHGIHLKDPEFIANFINQHTS